MIAQVTDVSEAGQVLILRNVCVFDGTGFTKSRSVVIKDDRIGNCDAEGASETVDCKGLFLIPGLIDAHVHLHNEGHLQVLASHGIITALDTAMWPAERMNGLRRKTGLPDIRSAELPVTAPGSLHGCMLPLPNEALLSDTEQADLLVQRRIEEGSDYIKIISDVPGPTQETLNAVSTAAHRRNMVVVAHASALTPFDMALKTNADIITHSLRNKPVTAAIT